MAERRKPEWTGRCGAARTSQSSSCRGCPRICARFLHTRMPRSPSGDTQDSLTELRFRSALHG
jgi:hypothetical protein